MLSYLKTTLYHIKHNFLILPKKKLANHNHTLQKISSDKTNIAIKITAYLWGGTGVKWTVEIRILSYLLMLNEILELKYLKNYKV